MKWTIFVFLVMLTGCVGNHIEKGMKIVSAGRQDLYSVAIIQKITSSTAPVHIYIEGDGYAFNGQGHASDDPTPHSRFMRNMAKNDKSPNVVYIARPCQFIMDKKCNSTDWTDGRFSKSMVESVASVIKKVAASRPVILVGYSGGAMISGLIIQNHTDIDVQQWITIAGVLDHDDWTTYFGDTPLTHSMNLNTLPRVPQVHYIAENDKTVPQELSKRWLGNEQIVVIPNATHYDIPIIKLNFIN